MKNKIVEKIHKSKESKVSIFCLIMVYKIIIELIYYVNISPIYDYSGLITEINYNKMIISNLLVLFVILISPNNFKRASSYFYLFIEIFIFVPLLSFYWLANESSNYVLFVTASFIVIASILKIRLKHITIRNLNVKPFLEMFFYIYILIALFLIIKRGGIDTRAFNFDTIYELRAENELIGIWGYMTNWVTKVFGPFFFAYNIYFNKKYKCVIVIFIQLLMYLSFGNKAFLFSIPLMLICAYLISKKKFIKSFLSIFILTNISAHFLDVIFGIDFLRRAIPYRMIFVPAMIQFQHYDFFSNSTKLYFAEGLLGSIFGKTNPYGIPIPILISRVYSGKFDSMAYSNTGIFADAYYNGGFVMMILISILLAVILYIIDSISFNIPVGITTGAFSYTFFVLNDTGLFTTLLTGGMVIMIVLLLFMDSVIYVQNNNESRMKKL
ncbi:O-antigen polymerase [Clostridium sp.]|uniref:O-antigen polymerase n=1 Tax=Clostridium sp. TaxID=1506 RepID=UPI0032172E20